MNGHVIPPAPPVRYGYSFITAVKRILTCAAVVAVIRYVVNCNVLDGPLSPVLRIPEAHVGVYWHAGLLSTIISKPGIYWKLPLFTGHAVISLAIKTQLENVTCATQDGIPFNFEKIEVESELAEEMVYPILKEYGTSFEKVWILGSVPSKLNRFCVSHTFEEVYKLLVDKIGEKIKDLIQSDLNLYARGVTVLMVRVSKPLVPTSIRQSYEMLEAQKIESEMYLSKVKALTDAIYDRMKMRLRCGYSV